MAPRTELLNMECELKEEVLHMSEKYYEVETRWGHFRLDEGAYQDYLNNSLWITWTPPWVEGPCHKILESEDG